MSGSQIIQRLMFSLLVVKRKIFGQSLTHFINVGIVVQKNIFVFDCPPKSLGKNIIHATPASVHTDLNFLSFQNGDVVPGGVVHALVGIMNIRNVDFQSFLKRLNAEFIFKGWRKFPGQNVAGIPVDNGGQIDESVFQSDVRNVGTPDLVGLSQFSVLLKGTGISCAACHPDWYWAFS